MQQLRNMKFLMPTDIGDGTNYSEFETDGTLKFKLLNYVAQDELYMYNDFAVVQTWTQDNKVGIMNTNPTHTLDITGGLIASSSITATGGFYGDGSNLTGDRSRR